MGTRYFTKCEKCNQEIEISSSKAIQGLLTQNQALHEELGSVQRRMFLLRKQKIGQVRALHGMIKRIYAIMTPEQRTQCFEMQQDLRDEMKKIQRETR